MSHYYEQYHRIVEQIARGEVEDPQEDRPDGEDDGPAAREREIRRAFIRALIDEFEPPDKP